MIKYLEILIALRYMRSKNKEAFISVVSAFSFIGIALGVATLIIVMSVMSGYETQLIKRILGINGHITVHMNSSNLDYQELATKIGEIKEVQFVAPIVIGQAMVSAKSSRGVIVRGMSLESIKNKPSMGVALSSEALFSYKHGEGVLIGSSMARDLQLDIGDSIRLIAPKFESLAFGVIPRVKTFNIIGIFDVGMYEYNSSTIFMPLELAQLFFDHKNRVTDLEVILHHPDNVLQVKESIGDLADDDLFITDWTSVNESLVAALRVERNVMFFILSLIILIAAFNIISSLIMLVQDKKKSVAILRTIGMSRISVLRIFIICGFIIGLLGTAIGSLLGIIFTLNIETIRQKLESLTGTKLFDPVIYFLTSLPAELSIINTIIIISVSLILSFLATIYPAWKAASLMPAVALRYE